MEIIDLGQIESISIDELERAKVIITEELKERVTKAGKAQASEGSIDLTYSNKLDVVPYMEKNLIYCPGVKVTKSFFTHKCTFISINGVWCWEYEQKIKDQMIYTKDGSMQVVNSLTLLPVEEGMALDVVSCKATGGDHKVIRVESYEVSENKLLKLKSRKINFTPHR